MFVSNGVWMCTDWELRTEVAAHYGPFGYESAASWTSLNRWQRKQGTEGTKGTEGAEGIEGTPGEGGEDGDSRDSQGILRPSDSDKVVPLILEVIERVSLVSDASSWHGPARNGDMITVITVPTHQFKDVQSTMDPVKYKSQRGKRRWKTYSAVLGAKCSPSKMWRFSRVAGGSIPAEPTTPGMVSHKESQRSHKLFRKILSTSSPKNLKKNIKTIRWISSFCTDCSTWHDCLHHFDCSSKCSSGQRGIQRASSISSFEGTKGSSFPPTFCVKVGHGGFVSVEIFCFCDCLVRKFSFGCEDFLTRWRWKAWKADRCRDVTRQTSLFLGTLHSARPLLTAKRCTQVWGVFYIFCSVKFNVHLQPIIHAKWREFRSSILPDLGHTLQALPLAQANRMVSNPSVWQRRKSQCGIIPNHTRFILSMDDSMIPKLWKVLSPRQIDNVQVRQQKVSNSVNWFATKPAMSHQRATFKSLLKGFGIAWAIWKASCQFPRVTGCHL